MNQPSPAQIVLSPEHFKAIRLLKGLAQTGINAMDPDLREDELERARVALDLIAKALAVKPESKGDTAPVLQPASESQP